MYLLDTNVISELRVTRSRPSHPNVVQWSRSVSAASLYLSTITIFELELGLVLPAPVDAVKAKALRSWIDGHVLPSFFGRILPVDTEVAQRCAGLHVPNTRAGRDAFIAATALVHNLIVITRNVRDFDPTGVRTLDPWQG